MHPSIRPRWIRRGVITRPRASLTASVANAIRMSGLIAHSAANRAARPDRGRASHGGSARGARPAQGFGCDAAGRTSRRRRYPDGRLVVDRVALLGPRMYQQVGGEQHQGQTAAQPQRLLVLVEQLLQTEAGGGGDRCVGQVDAGHAQRCRPAAPHTGGEPGVDDHQRDGPDDQQQGE